MIGGPFREGVSGLTGVLSGDRRIRCRVARSSGVVDSFADLVAQARMTVLPRLRRQFPTVADDAFSDALTARVPTTRTWRHLTTNPSGIHIGAGSSNPRSTSFSSTPTVFSPITTFRLGTHIALYVRQTQASMSAGSPLGIDTHNHRHVVSDGDQLRPKSGAMKSRSADAATWIL